MNDLVGQQFDSYTIKEKIGQGFMGIIYLAHEAQKNEDVVLKVLHPMHRRDASITSRFSRERAVTQLNHANIVKVYHFGALPQDQRPFIEMEYLPNGSLEDMIASGQVGPQFEASAALRLIDQLAAALQQAHKQGILHRDIKPSNVLMRDAHTPVLTDFGMAAVEGYTQLTRTGDVLGTPSYMAPEQMLGQKVDARADIYALGVMLYELLTGTKPGFQYPRQKASLHYLPHTLSPYTYNVVSTCLADEPNGRFATVDALRKAIKQALAAESNGGALPRSATIRQNLRHNWWIWLLIAIISALLVLVIVLLLAP